MRERVFSFSKYQGFLNIEHTYGFLNKKALHVECLLYVGGKLFRLFHRRKLGVLKLARNVDTSKSLEYHFSAQGILTYF